LIWEIAELEKYSFNKKQADHSTEPLLNGLNNFNDVKLSVQEGFSLSLKNVVFSFSSVKTEQTTKYTAGKKKKSNTGNHFYFSLGFMTLCDTSSSSLKQNMLQVYSPNNKTQKLR